MLNDHDVLAPVSRRTALRRGAALGGALVWAAPTVQVLGLGAVQAATSAPPTGETPTTPRPGRPRPRPAVAVRARRPLLSATPAYRGRRPHAGRFGAADQVGPQAAAHRAAGGPTGTQASALPRTGATVSPVDAAVAGAALLAGGAALRRLGRTPADG